MVAVNPMNIILLLTSIFENQYHAELPANQVEMDLKDVLVRIIKDGMQTKSFYVEEDTYLHHDKLTTTSEYLPADDFTLHPADDDVVLPEASESDCPPQSEIVDLAYKKSAVDYWKTGKKKPYSYEVVKNRFRKVKSINQLYRWQEELERGGNRIDKLRAVSQYTWEKYEEARSRGLLVHDIDVRRWALEAAQMKSLMGFYASSFWLLRFKANYNIVSRKVTKIVTHISPHSKATLESQMQIFVGNVKRLIAEHGPERVYNTDQSGFKLEMHTGRTLAEKGSKDIIGVVQSISSTTHSYTIQPTISADGKLLSPLLVVLKEVTGQLGPRVQESMFRPQNLYIMASKSGKLTKQHVREWAREVFFPNVEENTVLLMDSWRGQCPQMIDEEKPENKNISVLNIPEGATKYIQPLDVFTFRQWKSFVRRFSEMIMLYNYDVNLHSRDNILKLQSLTHNQFSSPRFVNMFKYAWYDSGYIQTRPDDFVVPADFCFAVPHGTPYDFNCHICGKPAFITCAWCKKPLCFEHFYTHNHYCSDYVP